MDAIFTRRSVRKFQDKEVSAADLELVLRAAMRAPSAGNEQPWEFIVLAERETMLGITGFHPYAKLLDHVPCTVVVCANLARAKFPGHDYWVQDCSAATQNMLLQAHSMGLGAVWLGLYPLPERVQGMQALLGLPETVVPLSAVALGHPAEVPPPQDTFDATRIHYGKW